MKMYFYDEDVKMDSRKFLGLGKWEVFLVFQKLRDLSRIIDELLNKSPLNEEV